MVGFTGIGVSDSNGVEWFGPKDVDLPPDMQLCDRRTIETSVYIYCV